jgi:hypothetical protein
VGELAEHFRRRWRRTLAGRARKLAARNSIRCLRQRVEECTQRHNIVRSNTMHCDRRLRLAEVFCMGRRRCTAVSSVSCDRISCIDHVRLADAHAMTRRECTRVVTAKVRCDSYAAFVNCATVEMRDWRMACDERRCVLRDHSGVECGTMRRWSVARGFMRSSLFGGTCGVWRTTRCVQCSSDLTHPASANKRRAQKGVQRMGGRTCTT